MLIREALGAPPSKPRWSDPASCATSSRRATPGSPRPRSRSRRRRPPTYVAEHVEHHPLWLMAEPALREKGRYDEVVERSTAIFEEANEDPSAFRTTSRYLVHTVTV